MLFYLCQKAGNHQESGFHHFLNNRLKPLRIKPNRYKYSLEFCSFSYVNKLITLLIPKELTKPLINCFIVLKNERLYPIPDLNTASHYYIHQSTTHQFHSICWSSSGINVFKSRCILNVPSTLYFIRLPGLSV